MGLFSLFNPNYRNLPSSIDFEFDYAECNRGYLKQMALETVIGYVAKSIATSEFRYSKNGKRIKDATDYSLNVRPNTDQSAFEFWYEFVYKLINDGQVLAIFANNGDLLIADSFDREEYVFYADIFKNVTIKGYTIDNTYNMDEVIFLKYRNIKLDKFLNSMFSDYTDLFNRMIEGKKINNQYRAKVNIDANLNITPAQVEKTQSKIDNMFKTIREKAVAFLPVTKGFDLEELSNGSDSSSSVEELNSIKDNLVNEVADIIGVPQNLVHGNTADLDSQIKSYVKFCIDPFNKMIEDELNAKLIGKKDYMDGERIEVHGIRIKEVTESADAVDKLVASGAFTRNDVRELFGVERSDNELLDEFVITKNYTTAESIEGGENNKNGTEN